MTLVDTDRATFEFRRSGVIGIAFDRTLGFIATKIERHRMRRRQKLDRAAFMTLVGKEDWVYRDLGIHPGDVEWAARLPLHVNAARELEQLRARTLQGR